jgi:hypothetical protein
LDWVRDNKRSHGRISDARGVNALRYVLVSSLDEKFPIKWERHMVGKLLDKDGLSIRGRVYVYRSVSRAHLQLRPAGSIDLGAGYESAERRMVYNSLGPGSQAHRAFFYGESTSSGFIDVSFSIHPSFTIPTNKPAMTLLYDGLPLRSGDYSAYSGSSLVLELQHEATLLLLGEKVPSQSIMDLAIYPSVVRSRLARIAQGKDEEPRQLQVEEESMEGQDSLEDEGPSASAADASSAGPSGSTKLPPTDDIKAAWDEVSHVPGAMLISR